MTARHSTALVLAALALSISACGFLTDDSVHVVIRTDKDAYVAEPGNSVSLTATNQSDQPLYFACYGWIDLQLLEGGRVTRSWNISGREQCGVQTLDKGDSTVRNYPFDEDSNFHFITDARYDSLARYRFRFRMYKEYPLHHEIDREDEYSNEFSMVKPTG